MLEDFFRTQCDSYGNSKRDVTEQLFAEESIYNVRSRVTNIRIYIL